MSSSADNTAPTGGGADARRTLEEALKRCDAEIRRSPRLAAAHCRRGVVLQSLGRYGEALDCHERAIRLDPGFGEAHYRKGNLLTGLRRLEEALASYERALACTKDFAPAWNGKARALRALGRLDEALLNCDTAIGLEPGDADAHLNRGNVLMELGRHEHALGSYDRAIALKPDLPEAHNNRGNALRRLGRNVEALESFEHAVTFRPAFAEAHHAKGNILADLNRADEAVLSYDRAIDLRPGLAEAHNNRGMALHRLGHFDEALKSYDRAIAVKSAYALALNNRSTTLRELDRLEDALRDCVRATALDPGLAEAHYNKGNILKGLKRPDDAIRAYDSAIALRPALAEARWNKAICTLLMGRFTEGWPLYEQRQLRLEPAAPAGQTLWTGAEKLGGRSLYVRGEQGFGDTIQFCRYALLAAERGADVVVAVQNPLVRLLKSLGPAIRVVDVAAAATELDLHVALLSMPLAFGTDAQTIPGKTPYLAAEPQKILDWKARVGGDGFKIGICWQGAKGGEVDVGRSFPVRHFARMAAIPAVRLISLQKGDGVEQLLELPAAMKVESFGDELDPGPDAFVDTAAIMENLDLVITSDTAVAHLAGALGRPVWVALSFVPDWRWLLDRCDSPWYPTMRLFRQTERGDWAGVFATMEGQLISMLRDRQDNP